MKTTHYNHATNAILQRLIGAIGAPDEYSEVHDQWAWGRLGGVYAEFGVEFRADSFRGDRVHFCFGKAGKVLVAIDESATPISATEILALLAEQPVIASRPAPMASVLSTAREMMATITPQQRALPPVGTRVVVNDDGTVVPCVVTASPTYSARSISVDGHRRIDVRGADDPKFRVSGIIHRDENVYGPTVTYTRVGE